jgi:hypothetical protein
VASLYSSLAWRAARRAALDRDGERCTVARLLGGICSASLHVHHLKPVREGGDRFGLDNLVTVCSTHHPQLEGVRRAVLAERGHDERLARAAAFYDRMAVHYDDAVMADELRQRFRLSPSELDAIMAAEVAA